MIHSHNHIAIIVNRTKSDMERAMDDSMSSSMSIPSRYPSISETMTTKKAAATDMDYGSLSLEDSRHGREPLIGPSKKDIPGIIQVRHQMAIFLFLGMMAVCSMRQNVSVAMVAMVNDSYVTNDQPIGNVSWEDGQTCGGSAAPNTTDQTSGGEFPWNAQTQELLLAGYYYGYIFTQIPGGWLSDRYGMKWVLGLGILLSSICTLLGPVAAYGGTAWYFVTRFFGGFGEGVSFPCSLAMWSKWAHPDERSSLSVIGFVGFNLGNVAGNALTGYLISLDVLGGWPLGFYVFGAFGCLWFILWSFVAYSSPSEHPWISKEEREYIEEGLKHSKRSTSSIPWRSLFTSPTMWCMVFTQFAHALSIFTLLVNLPLYFSEGLQVSIEEAGVYSALPYAMQIVCMLAFSFISDAILARQLLTKTATRKLMAGLGFWSGALLLVVTGFARCNIALSVASVTLSMGGIGIAYCGHFVALLDIAGPFAGSAMGMMNTAGTVGGIIGPYIVGVVTEIQTDIRGWQNVMWIISGFYCFGGIVFVFFGTAKLQPWARSDYQTISGTDHI